MPKTMNDSLFLPRDALQTLIEQLKSDGFRVIGPCVHDDTIQYRDLADSATLPFGWTDDQAPGNYRLTQVDSPRAFAWATGAQALKPYLFKPRETLWRAQRDAAGKLTFSSEQIEDQPLAFIGVRACDIAALKLHDKHFLDGVKDSNYAARRAGLFIVAVHCAYPADTCFCASTGDGPAAADGFDLALNELEDGYLVEVGSERGKAIAARLPLAAASSDLQHQGAQAVAEAAKRQHRQLPSGNLQKPLFERLHHPRWDQVAARCLSCGNCTSVCPTCFCNAQIDAPALGGEVTEHLREWDSCFTEGHSYLHGFMVRPETGHRYRQWLTHKLGSWHEQYGRSGCVGCGRCITWCPVGIDLTEEANVLCNSAAGESPQ